MRSKTIQYAGFGRRTLAILIDALLFGAIMHIIFGAEFMQAQLWSLEAFFSNFISIAVTIYLWTKILGTPGKLLMQCEVVDADNFQPITVRQAMLRYFGYLVSTVSLMIGFLWIAFDKRNQGFHDKIANTVVVYKRYIELYDESQKSLQQLMCELR